MEDLIFRQESDKIIVWSKKFKAYFYATDKKYEIEVDNFLQGKQVESVVLDELKKLGDLNSRKIFVSDNEKGLMSPLEYYFDFTSACNLTCTHCYNRFKLKQKTMSVNQIKHIIEDMYHSGVMRLHLAGGEPTLYLKELRAYLETAKNYGIVTSMASNGTLITDEVCEIFSSSNLFSITISVESANEDKNSSIRGSGCLSKSIEGITKLVEYKEKNNANYLVGIKVSYDTNFSKQDFEDLIKLAISLNVNVIKFANPERCVYHEEKHYSSVATKYYENMRYVRELTEKYSEQIFITQISSPVNQCAPIGLPGMRGCIGAQELVAIAPDGKITPCLMNGYNLGNIADYKSIKDVYTSEKIANYNKLIQKYDCEQCSSHSQCRGGCQVRKFVEYKEIKGIDPLCPIKCNIKMQKTNYNKPITIFQKINVLHSL